MSYKIPSKAQAILLYFFSGIPTVKREFQSYLVPTMQSVFDNMNEVKNEFSYFIIHCRIYWLCDIDCVERIGVFDHIDFIDNIDFIDYIIILIILIY